MSDDKTAYNNSLFEVAKEMYGIYLKAIVKTLDKEILNKNPLGTVTTILASITAAIASHIVECTKDCNDNEKKELFNEILTTVFEIAKEGYEKTYTTTTH